MHFFTKKIKIHAQTPKYTLFQRLTFLPPLHIIQPIPPLHTSLTHYAQAQPKAHKPRYKRYFKHTSNPKPKAQKRKIAFLHLQFFFTKIKNLCKLFHNPRKTNYFKSKKTNTPKLPPLQMWAEWAAKSNKANVGTSAKKVKNGKARGKNNSNVGENTKKLKQKINAKKLVKMWGGVWGGANHNKANHKRRQKKVWGNSKKYVEQRNKGRIPAVKRWYKKRYQFSFL